MPSFQSEHGSSYDESMGNSSIFRVSSALLIAAAFGCGGTSITTPNPVQPNDSPYNARDDADAQAIYDHFAAEPPGQTRLALQQKLSRAYIRQLERRVRSRHIDGAAFTLRKLGLIFSPTEIRDGRAGKHLQPYTAALEKALALFSKAGKSEPAVLALELLNSANPSKSKHYETERDDLFLFADELAVAEYGDGAERSSTIEILQKTLDVYPSDSVVSRLAKLLVERQHALEAKFRTEGANFNLIRAHGPEVLRTSWHVIRAYARGGKLKRAPATLRLLSGLGRNLDLETRLSQALARNSTPLHWLRLATVFRGNEDEPADFGTALAICELAAVRFPKSEEVHVCMADFSAETGAVQKSIRLYEETAELGSLTTQNKKKLRGLYLGELDRLSSAGRMREATVLFDKMSSFLNSDTNKKSVIAAALTTMARGQLNQGRIKGAEHYLNRSLRTENSASALELLGIIAIKHGHFVVAEERFEQALRNTSQNLLGKVQSARIFRELAEIKLQHRTAAGAKVLLKRSLKEWRKLSTENKLSKKRRAEVVLETGKVLWLLGRHIEARDTMAAALEVSGNDDMYSQVLAFLTLHGDYATALDTYHRALASPKIREQIKTYMSLWIVALSKRKSRPQIGQAMDYLKNIDGTLWHQSLAQYASGKLSIANLRSRAINAGQKAELNYYAAALGAFERPTKQTEKLLRRVIASNVILFFEFEMAQTWLANLDSESGGTDRIGKATPPRTSQNTRPE